MKIEMDLISNDVCTLVYLCICVCACIWLWAPRWHSGHVQSSRYDETKGRARTKPWEALLVPLSPHRRCVERRAVGKTACGGGRKGAEVRRRRRNDEDRVDSPQCRSSLAGRLAILALALSPLLHLFFPSHRHRITKLLAMTNWWFRVTVISKRNTFLLISALWKDSSITAKWYRFYTLCGKKIFCIWMKV